MKNRQKSRIRRPLTAEAPSAEDRVFFRLGLILLAAAGILLVLGRIYAGEEIIPVYPRPCPFLELTGLCCPGCGGTRALRALLHGRLGESLRFHPAVVPAVLLYFGYMLSQALWRIRGGKGKLMTWNDLYLYALLAVILLQWIVKNIILLASA